MMIYIFWGCQNKQEAEGIIQQLLQKHLIACASILPEVESIYRWEGKIEKSREVKVLIKTLDMHFEAVQNYIQKNCSYQVPEIAQIEIKRTIPSYLEWLVKELN